MSELIGVQVYERLKNESAFQSSNSELIKEIAIDLVKRPADWNGLNYLNEFNPSKWDRLLYKIIKLQPGNWETGHKTFVEFIKIIAYNWSKSIPGLLKNLEDYDVGIKDFFNLERNVTYKFSSLLQDINTLQKEILKDKHQDISRFIFLCSHAFLPKVVFQLEEYGLPRMISKKIHSSNLVNFFEKGLTIHRTIEILNDIGIKDILNKTSDLDDFDKYILEYFFESIRINSKPA